MSAGAKKESLELTPLIVVVEVLWVSWFKGDEHGGTFIVPFKEEVHTVLNLVVQDFSLNELPLCSPHNSLAPGKNVWKMGSDNVVG